MGLLGASFVAGRPEDHIPSEADVDFVLAAMGDPYDYDGALDLLELIARTDATAAGLADRLDLPAKIMAAIVEGNARPPMPSQMREKFAAGLGVDPTTIDAALAASAAAPRTGLLKASAAPRIRQRSFAEIIAKSGMSDDRKAFWLRDD